MADLSAWGTVKIGKEKYPVSPDALQTVIVPHRGRPQLRTGYVSADELAGASGFVHINPKVHPDARSLVISQGVEADLHRAGGTGIESVKDGDATVGPGDRLEIRRNHSHRPRRAGRAAATISWA